MAYDEVRAKHAANAGDSAPFVVTAGGAEEGTKQVCFGQMLTACLIANRTPSPAAKRGRGVGESGIPIDLFAIFPVLAIPAPGFSRNIRESDWILYASELLERQFVRMEFSTVLNSENGPRDQNPFLH